MLVWTCVSSGKSGLYSNYHRHLTRCDYCTPELEEERQQLKEEKQISKIQELQTLYDGGHTCNDCFYSFLYSRTTSTVSRDAPVPVLIGSKESKPGLESKPEPIRTG